MAKSLQAPSQPLRSALTLWRSGLGWEIMHTIALRPMTKNPLKAVVGADRDAYFWIKKKFGLGEYQMGALVWFSGLIIGILLGVWVG